MMQTYPQPNASRRRWRLQFGLSSLLLLTTAVAAWLAYYWSPPKRGERAVESLQGSGAQVLFDYQRQPDGSTYSHQVDPPGPEAVRQIAGEGLFQDAEWIRLHNTAVSIEALAPLADLPGLRRLTLPNCNISDEHMKHIGSLRNLVLLDLKSNQITDAGLRHLHQLTGLEILSLSKNEIRGDGLKKLGAASQLKKLYLHDNPISDEEAAHIVQFVSLESLGLAGTRISDEALLHFAGLKNLRYLGVTRTNVTTAGIKQLRRRLPNCEIEH